MSEEQLYEMAKARVTQRSRRWTLLGINIFAFLIYVGAIIALRSVTPASIGRAGNSYFSMDSSISLYSVGVFIAAVWIGVIVLHLIAISIAQGRDKAIEGEVERLRHTDEKPKRLELSEDGEAQWVDEPEKSVKRR